MDIYNSLTGPYYDYNTMVMILYCVTWHYVSPIAFNSLYPYDEDLPVCFCAALAEGQTWIAGLQYFIFGATSYNEPL